MVRPRSAPTGPVWTADRAGVLFVGVVALTVVPKVLQTLTAAKYRVRVDEAIPAATPLTAAATDLLIAAVLGWSLLAVLDGLRRNPRRGLLGVVLLLAPWLLVELRGWTLGVVPSPSDLVYPAVVVAVWVLRPGLRHLRLLGYLAGLVAVVSLLIGVLLPDQAVSRSIDGGLTQEEGVLPIGVLVGVFTQGNTLGQYLLLGLPLVALVRGRVLRAVLLAATGFALVWSAARGEIAGAVGLVVAVALLSRLPADRRSVPVRLVLWVAFGLVAAVPLLTTDPGAFTRRGAIWQESLALWHRHVWFGNGSAYYRQVAQTSADLGGTVYHGHNLLVHLLVTGGVALAVLVGCLLLYAVGRAADAARGGLTGFAVLLALAAASLLEISLVPGSTDVFDPVLLLPLATLVVGEPMNRADLVDPADPSVRPGAVPVARAHA